MDRKLVYGIAFNDADYTVIKTDPLTKRRVSCKIYCTWKNLLRRCYIDFYRKRNLNYEGCTVCNEWLTFSNFRAWMEKQDWEGKHLDKDILNKGNKVYNPEDCVFVNPIINTFFNDHKRARGEYLLGVHKSKSNRFVARCCDTIRGKRVYLGDFEKELDAHLAWKKYKHKVACELASSNYVTDSRVKYALENWYK